MNLPKTQLNFSRQQICQIIAWALVLLFLFLATYQYFYTRPLWNDEHAVFVSLRSFDAHEMFHKPLLKGQAFPRVYLFLVQKISERFDYSLLSLRFLSFVAMILAFGVWGRIGWQYYEGKGKFLLFLLCWLASGPLIYYASELKPYSMDVLVSGIWILFLTRQAEIERHGKWHLAAVFFLPMTCLVSYPAFFFIPIFLWDLFMRKIHGEACGRTVVALLCSLGIFVSVAYLWDIRLKNYHILSGVLKDYFISSDSASDFFKTLGEGINNLFSRFFIERPRIFRKITIFFVSLGLIQMFASFFVGFFKNKFRTNTIPIIAFLLFVELAVAGALKWYPFTLPRTSLFFAPLVFVATIDGISNLSKIHRFLYLIVNSMFIAFLFVMIIGIIQILLLGEFCPAPMIKL